MIKINLNPDRKKTKVRIKKPGFKVPTITAPKEGLIYFTIPIVVFILEFGYLMFLHIEIKKLEQNFQIKQIIDLQPYDKDHAMVVAIFLG